MNPFDKNPNFRAPGSESDTLPPQSFTMDPEFAVFSEPPSSPFINLEAFSAGEEGLVVVQPMECLHGTQIPPFLSKTFDLVDDSSLDFIISWGSKGESFVVWDPVEFSRMILPKNFKHNNFSSFVRQLNTYVGITLAQSQEYLAHVLGFRKVDADRWEFANEGFLRGKRHLLKNIQRRRSPQSHQAGSSSAEAGKSAMDEVEKLRKEKSLMMQEVIELQQQQRGTVQQMEAVDEKLRTAELRQKRMVSFLAKVFQNPTFLARLRQMKEQGKITSPRTMRKFIKHQPHDQDRVESSIEGQIVKYMPDFQDLVTSFKNPDFNLVVDQQLPETGFGAEAMLFKNQERVIEGALNFNPEDSHFEGKNVASPQLEVMPECFVSFPEELAKEKNILKFSSPGIESMVKEEEVWSTGFEASAVMSSTGIELWGSLSNYDVPDFGVTAGLSDVLWDIDPLQEAGSSGVDKWPNDESPFGQPKNDSF